MAEDRSRLISEALARAVFGVFLCWLAWGTPQLPVVLALGVVANELYGIRHAIGADERLRELQAKQDHLEDELRAEQERLALLGIPPRTEPPAPRAKERGR